jgi:hypothetical protein
MWVISDFFFSQEIGFMLKIGFLFLEIRFFLLSRNRIYAQNRISFFRNPIFSYKESHHPHCTTTNDPNQGNDESKQS